MQKNLYGKKMKTAFIKDAVRNILKNKASYISIILISFLGVTSFLGLDYTATTLRHIGSDEYNRLNYRDLEISSPLFLTEEDFNEILATEGIKDAEKVYYSAGRAVSEKARQNISIISLTKRINKTEAIEGRLPEIIRECAIEKRLADDMGWNIGDRVNLYSRLGEKNEDIKEGIFEITGFINHLDHTNPKTPEYPYVVLVPEAFVSYDSASGIMAVEAVIDNEKNNYRFGKSYTENVENVSEKLKVTGDKQYSLRYEELRSELSDETQSYIDELIEEGILDKGISEEEFVYNLKLALTDDSEEIQSHKDLIKEYLDTREKLVSLKDEGWLITDIRGSSNFISLMVDCDNITKLEMTMSLMFLFIGILVIYATISKIINEQRMQVGTMKAFGFGKGEVLTKYLFFGVSANLLGSVLGILASRFILEVLLLKNYNVYYTFDTVKPNVTFLPTLFIIVFSILLASASGFFACRRLLGLSAVSLLSPRIPRIKRKNGDNNHFLNLYLRLIIRNSLMDAKRVIVTVVSVAGCCALIVTGFTLKSDSDKCPDRHFSEIISYDEKINAIENTEYVKEIEDILKENGAPYVLVYETNVSVRMGKNDIGNLICGDIAAFENFYHLYDVKTGQPLEPTDLGVYIPRRTAELYSLKEGDEITITSTDYQTVKVNIAGVFENYIGTPLVMSEKCYDRLFIGQRIPNTFYLKTENADAEKLESELLKNPGYNNTVKAEESRSLFDSATTVINIVIVLFIFLSVLMAAVVLVNLTNMYLLQKKSEITIMRINGFTVSETIGYMMRETILTTITGIVLGCATGYFLSYRILCALEQPYIHLIKEPGIAAWLIGAGMTAVFVLLVNLFVLGKIRNFKLSDI